MRRTSRSLAAVLLAVCLATAGCAPDGANKVTISNVVGLTQAAATSAIIAAGLAVGTVTQEFSATVAVDLVIAQSPAGGASVSPGSVVALTVSRGPERAHVSNAVGLAQAAASALIIGQGLTVGAVTQTCSPTVAAGMVISQNPAAGLEAAPGSAVALTVSTGPCPPAIEMLPVAAGTFTMGRTAGGDDAADGISWEDPRHEVTLGAYSIGKYCVTNRQYCDVLNWALGQGYLKNSTGAAWAGTGDIYAGGNLQLLMPLASSDCNIQYTGTAFTPKTRAGLPGSTSHPMDQHPVVFTTWYGAVAFCNWLSLWQGLTPCHDMTAANWPLTLGPPASGGYRLPTEAEWERAAAWDGSRHWIYGLTSDTLTSGNQANFHVDSPDAYINPLGLATMPFTSPVGWFNGVNVSPNGAVNTFNCMSPAGAYDMSGNAGEWCGDWFLDAYYTGGAMTNPVGPAAGTFRAYRGGSWKDGFYNCRSARRNGRTPDSTSDNSGFRLARTP